MKILDATCGTRTAWLRKHDPDTTYIDIRPEVKPDIVMDATHTTFQDKTFDIILFDPPHRRFSPNPREIFDSHKKGANYAYIYGSFTTSYIKSFISAAFAEFFRILKDDGLVFFKWNTLAIPLDKILPMAVDFYPIFGQNFNKISKHETVWLCMRKDPQRRQKRLAELRLENEHLKK